MAVLLQSLRKKGAIGKTIIFLKDYMGLDFFISIRIK
jgi:hypothetical protein